MKIKIHHDDGRPCGHMRPLLDYAADGRARRGFRVWYAHAHAALCPGCGRYLETMRELVGRLKGLRDEDDESAIKRLTNRVSE